LSKTRQKTQTKVIYYNYSFHSIPLNLTQRPLFLVFLHMTCKTDWNRRRTSLVGEGVGSNPVRSHFWWYKLTKFCLLLFNYDLEALIVHKKGCCLFDCSIRNRTEASALILACRVMRHMVPRNISPLVE